MFIDVYNKFYCKYMKFIHKYKKTVCKYLNWLELQIPAFRAFCKTDWGSRGLHSTEAQKPSHAKNELYFGPPLIWVPTCRSSPLYLIYYGMITSFRPLISGAKVKLLPTTSSLHSGANIRWTSYNKGLNTWLPFFVHGKDNK